MRLALLTSVVILVGGLLQSPADSPRFASDLAFLRQHTKVVVLGRRTDGAQIVVAPDYQGRVSRARRAVPMRRASDGLAAPQSGRASASPT